MKKRIYCAYCGRKVVVKKEEGVPRDFCESCKIFFYENPLPVVSAIVVSDRKVLLVKRGRKPYKGMWCLPTGFAETGESIEEAAVRELEEETGIKGSIGTFMDVDSSANYFYGDLLFITFEIEMTGGKLTTGSDCSAVKYFPIEKVPKLAFDPNKKAIDAYIRSKSDSWAIVDSFKQAIGHPAQSLRGRKLLSDHLIHFIEVNSEKIIQILTKDLRTNKSTPYFHKFDPSKISKRGYMVIRQFSKWLGGYYTDEDIRDYYVGLGRERRKEGFQLSEILSALSLTKKHIWEFALSQGIWQKMINIYMALELDRRIVIFFDKAAFYTARGYESIDREKELSLSNQKAPPKT